MRKIMRLRGWRRFHRIMAYLGAIGVAVVVLGPVLQWVGGAITPALGRLEGHLAPVSQDFTITRAEDDGVGVSLIWGHLTVNRPACVFEETRWTLTEGGRRARVGVAYLRGSIARPAGLSDFGPWRLTVPVARLPHLSAEVVHSCPFSPWPVVSPLYP